MDPYRKVVLVKRMLVLESWSAMVGEQYSLDEEYQHAVLRILSLADIMGDDGPITRVFALSWRKME